MRLFPLLIALPLLFLGCGDDDKPTGPKKGSYVKIDFNRETSEWIISMGCQEIEGTTDKESTFDWEQFSNDQICDNAYLILGIAYEPFTLKMTSTEAWGNYMEFSVLAKGVSIDGTFVYAVAVTLENQARNLKPVEVNPLDYQERLRSMLP